MSMTLDQAVADAQMRAPQRPSRGLTLDQAYADAQMRSPPPRRSAFASLGDAIAQSPAQPHLAALRFVADQSSGSSPGVRMPWGATWGRGFSPSAAARHALESQTFGLEDNAQGFAGGVRAALSGGSATGAYQSERDRTRAATSQEATAHPLSSGLGAIMGGIAQGPLFRALPFVNSLEKAAKAPRQSIGPLAEQLDPRPLLAQLGLGAYVGALGAGAYGAGQRNGTLDENARAAWDSAFRFDIRRPLETGGAWLGAAIPGLVGLFGKEGPVQAMLRNPGLRTGIGGLIGAGTGYASTPEGGDPLQRAGVGFVAGAGLGYGAPKIAGGVRRYADNVVQNAMRGQTNAFVGIPPMPPTPPARALSSAPPGGPSDDLIADLDRLTARRGWTSDELGQALGDETAFAREMERARLPELDTRLVDILGRQANAKMRSLVQGVGATDEVAGEVAEARARSMAPDLEGDVRRSLDVHSSPTQARAALEEARQTGADGYGALRETTPDADVVRSWVAPLMRFEPRMQDALRRQAGMEDSLARLSQNTPRDFSGPVQPRTPTVLYGDDGLPELNPNASASGLIDLKSVIDDELDMAANPQNLNAAGKTERANVLDEARAQAVGGLDRAMPQYGPLRDMYGDVFEGNRALTEGAKFFSLRPEEIMQRMRTNPNNGRPRPTTPFERQMYRTAIVDEAIRRVMTASREVGTQNAANALNSTEIQNVLRAAFDNNADAASAFLARLNARNRLMRNASGWGSGSSTMANAAQQGDQMVAQMVGAGMDMARNNPLGAVGRIGGEFWNALRGGALERRNDALGDALLRRPDDPLIQEALRKMRLREQARASRAALAAQAGAGVGAIPGAFDEGAY